MEPVVGDNNLALASVSMRFPVGRITQLPCGDVIEQLYVTIQFSDRRCKHSSALLDKSVGNHRFPVGL